MIKKGLQPWVDYKPAEETRHTQITHKEKETKVMEAQRHELILWGWVMV